MKRIISLFLILILLLSFCSCKKQDSGASASPDSLVENNQPETNEPKLQEPEKQEPETQVTVEKGEFHPYTVDDYFRPYEVIVTLTQEESGKGLKYTPKDFPELEILGIFDGFTIDNGFFGQYDYQPFAEDKVTLFLLLENPSKQTVLDYIEILKNDDRVFCAMPNIHTIVENTVYVVLNEEKSKLAYEESLKFSDMESSNYAIIPIELFPEFQELGVIEIDDPYNKLLLQEKCFSIHSDSYANNPQKMTVRLHLSYNILAEDNITFWYNTMQYKKDTQNVIPELNKVSYVILAHPIFKNNLMNPVYVKITEERAKSEKEITSDEFPGIMSDFRIVSDPSTPLYVRLSFPGFTDNPCGNSDEHNLYFSFSRTMSVFCQSNIVEKVYMTDATHFTTDVIGNIDVELNNEL